MDALFQSNEIFFKVVPQIIESIITHSEININSPEVNTTSDSKLTFDIKSLLKETRLEKSRLQELLGKCNYSEDKVKFFINFVEKHRTELMVWCITEHNSMYGDTVIDEDWKLKLILGTSENLYAVFPVLNLDAQIVSTSGSKELKKYEFTKADLANFVDALDASLRM